MATCGSRKEAIRQDIGSYAITAAELSRTSAVAHMSHEARSRLKKTSLGLSPKATKKNLPGVKIVKKF